jgi:anti-sigma factor RsiW
MRQDHTHIPLQEGIREIVAEDRLEPGELAELRRLAEGMAPAVAPAAAPPKGPEVPADPSRRRWLSVAAGVGVAGLAGLVGASLVGRGGHGGAQANAQSLAEEIAYNHLRVAPLDIASGELERLRDGFATLGFNLLDAAEVEGVPGVLMGGRFCSVASVPAAMLRYRTEEGVITVYQALYDPRRHRGAADMDAGMPGNVRHARGVEVCLCHTQGVLLAVASGGAARLA